MVRIVHMSIFYKLDFKTSDSKSDFLTNTEQSGFRKYETIVSVPPETFEVVSEIGMTLKYILDHSRVIPIEFPHETHILHEI